MAIWVLYPKNFFVGVLWPNRASSSSFDRICRMRSVSSSSLIRWYISLIFALSLCSTPSRIFSSSCWVYPISSSTSASKPGLSGNFSDRSYSCLYISFRRPFVSSLNTCGTLLARTAASTCVASTMIVPDFTNPFLIACWIVSFSRSSRISSVILVFRNFVNKLGSTIWSSGDNPRKYLFNTSSSSSSCGSFSGSFRRGRSSSDKSYSFFKNSSLNIISGSFAGLPNVSQYCFLSIGFTKLKSMFSFSLRKICPGGIIFSYSPSYGDKHISVWTIAFSTFIPPPFPSYYTFI